jgi:hypothetical protein
MRYNGEPGGGFGNLLYTPNGIDDAHGNMSLHKGRFSVSNFILAQTKVPRIVTWHLATTNQKW